MAKLIYVTNVSLDGYIEDEHGDFGWANPDDGYFAFITDLVRPVGTYLYGRRLYEAMAVWETDPTFAAQSELMADFARVWQTADKVVWSTTLAAVPTARTRVERRFDPDAVRELKDTATSDLMVGGAHLAAQAFHRAAGRRVPPLRGPRRPRWRQARAPRRPAHRPRPARRASLRQRRCLPAPPHLDLTAKVPGPTTRSRRHRLRRHHRRSRHRRSHSIRSTRGST